MKKIILTLCIFLSISSAHAQGIQTTAKHAILIDMGTGVVLLEKDADTKMPTSSMSKVMTAFMIFDAIQSNRISMDTEFTVSEKAWKMDGSKMFIEVGKQIPVQDLLRGLIIVSGNDAAVALAEGLSGDEAGFAAAMTAKAHELGMKNTNLMNASGLPDPEHYSTARDLSILGQNLINNFPNEYAFYSMREFTYNDITQPNRNPLLYKNMGVDGIKTGFTDAAGYGLMASGVKNNRRVMMVINGLESANERASESAKLMSWALNAFENVNVVKKGDVIDSVETVLAKTRTLPLMVEKDVFTTIPAGQKSKIKVTSSVMSPVKAPIQKGQVLGELTITMLNNQEIKIPLVAAENLEKTGFVSRAFENLKILLLGV